MSTTAKTKRAKNQRSLKLGKKTLKNLTVKSGVRAGWTGSRSTCENP